MLKAVDHVNLVVEDLERMLAFYTRVLGLTVSKRVTLHGDWVERVTHLKGVDAEVVFLSLPADETHLELIHYRSPAAPRAAGLGCANTPGLRHLAFRVDDIDAAADRIRQAGAEVFGAAETVPSQQVTYSGGRRKRLLYFRDPEGNLLELCAYEQPPPTQAPSP